MTIKSATASNNAPETITTLVRRERALFIMVIVYSEKQKVMQMLTIEH
jgi:hypothetical protein